MKTKKARLAPVLIASIAFLSIVFWPGQSRAQSGEQADWQRARLINYVTPDSTFGMQVRFRMQNRAVYNTISASDFGVSEYEMRVRRLRLRAEGFIYSPKLRYSVQLSFSRGDMDWSMNDASVVNNSPNVVRDAFISYQPSPNLTFIFGQTKLPGNRQRVISSGDQQFVDRSIVNVAFNIDRDFGFQAQYENSVGRFGYLLKGALTSGDGRNVITGPAGLAYTGRVELLPLGPFSKGGDYFEGDLAREQKVKLSLAGGMSYNDRARRVGGQIGRDLYQPRDMTTYIFDGLLKYRGVAFYAEHMAREAPDPFTLNPTGANGMRYILTGNGQNFQLSYLFPNDVEVAGRYSRVRPSAQVQALERNQEAFVAGVTKYLRGHRLKVQANAAYHNANAFSSVNTAYHWSGALQVELGI